MEPTPSQAYYQLLTQDTSEPGVLISRYRPTQHAQGAWNPQEQHMAPATGIICHELAHYAPEDNKRYGRISLDIIGMIYLDEFTVTTRCLRPGKTIELIESTLTAQGKTCIIARAWRMIQCDSRSIASLEDPPIASRDTLQPWDGISIWGGGFIQSLVGKVYADRRPGAGIVWLSNDYEMVEGQTAPPWVKLLGMVDTANGVVVRQAEPFKFAFPNLDLQIHLYRMPQGQWLGLQVQQQYGEDGIGLTSAILHDEQGPFGRSEQILTVRPMPQP